MNKLSLEKSRLSVQQTGVEVNNKLAEAEKLTQDVIGTYLSVDGRRDDTKIEQSLLPLVRLMDERSQVAQAWRDGSGVLTELQLSDDLEPYSGWESLRECDYLKEVIAKFDNISDVNALKAMKSDLAAERKAALKLASELKAL